MAGKLAGVSDEMRALFEGQKRLHEAALRLQRQIEEEEAVYLEETVHGNIVRGWDGFIDSKPSRKEANPKKLKPYSEAEHLFSGCCRYAELGGEPSFDLVDYNNSRDDSAGRRRLTVTLSGGAKISSEVATGGGGHSGGHAHGSSGSGGGKGGGSKLSSIKAGAVRGSGLHSSKGGASATASSASAGVGHRTGKLHKKRKLERLDEEEDTASGTSTPLRSRATSVEDLTGDDDTDTF